MPVTRRFLLAASLALALPAQADTPATVTLIRDGQRLSLSIDPATLGNRSSWNSYDGVLSVHFLASGPEGDWIIGLAVENGQGRDGTMIPPAGAAHAVSDVQIAVQRARVQGNDLDLAGSVSDPATGLRIEFALTLPHIDFAPTPGPTPQPAK
ncbi:hypothetical protein [Pararhodobacter zhoushanensis]|uniref:hypothetical protein n=1 Tax=Pararhodobacter zhoushanensis TaxID=2479545 RepID=UPI000F8F0BF6|nr:hypothetical protein [Pararhodobacter zhoushanensis]